MSSESFYPPSPANVDPRLTRTPWGFRLRVLAVIAALFGFLILYVLIAAAAAAGAWWLVTVPVRDGLRPRAIVACYVLKYGGALALSFLWLFLLKGIFKCRRTSFEDYVEISEDEYPTLFSFIRRVHEEVRSPAPSRVYVDASVNAAVLNDVSLLNLLVPPKQHLLIGLGLVHSEDLVGFKNTLAHEFGHFTQGTGRLTAYTFVLFTAVRDLVASRDWADDFVDRWCNLGRPLSVPGWILKGILWCLRKVFGYLLDPLDRVYTSLRRQAEFRADNISITVTGSDEVARGLYRIRFWHRCHEIAERELGIAARYGRYSSDLYYHMDVVARRARTKTGNPQLRIPPDLPADQTTPSQLFTPDPDEDSDKYSTHPSDYAREVNANRYYVRGPQDPRSSWVLFGDPTEIRRQVTQKFYECELRQKKDLTLSPPEVVQAFVDAESVVSFDVPDPTRLFKRWFQGGSQEQLPKEPWTPAAINQWLANWPPAEMDKLFEGAEAANEEYSRIRSSKIEAEGSLKTSFEYDGIVYKNEDVQGLLDKVRARHDSLWDQINDIDRRMVDAHWSIATRLDERSGSHPGRREALEKYYKTLQTVERLRDIVTDLFGRLRKNSEKVEAFERLPADGVAEWKSYLNETREDLQSVLDRSKECICPAMQNVAEGTVLYDLIVDRRDNAIPVFSGKKISGRSFGNLWDQLSCVEQLSERTSWKCMTALILLQNQLVDEWKATFVDNESPGHSSNNTE